MNDNWTGEDKSEMNKYIIREWEISKRKLDIAKAKELERRQAICDYILAGKTKGSKKTTIDGITLTATAKTNTTIDEPLLKTLWGSLSPEEKQAIKFKPSLRSKEYKQLPENCEMQKAITQKPGTPTLKVKEDKNET